MVKAFISCMVKCELYEVGEGKPKVSDSAWGLYRGRFPLDYIDWIWNSGVYLLGYKKRPSACLMLLKF